VPPLPGADADHFLHRVDEDQAVAGHAGIGGPEDGLNGIFQVVFAQDDVDLDLGQQIDPVAACTARQADASLAAVAANFEEVQAHDAHFLQGFLDIVELVFPNDGFDLF